jgi:membrane protein YdbS with pleckstrin-like domain
MKGVKWLVTFAIDYGSIALVLAVAAIYLWGTVDVAINPPVSSGMSGIAAVFGVLLVLLAVKVWRDVRSDRSRER